MATGSTPSPTDRLSVAAPLVGPNESGILGSMKTTLLSAALVLGLGLGLGLGCKDSAEKTGKAGDKPAATEGTDKPDDKPTDEPKADPKPEPPKIDFTAGQSTGKQTEDRPGKEYRNTLVDKEIGATVTCPVDKTWKCKLEANGMWKVRDMSSNVFTLRAVPGATSAAEAIKRETAYLSTTLPAVAEKAKGEDSVTLSVGPNPKWAKKVPRVAWLKVTDVGGKWFACHGIGSESNFDNASKDYAQLCDSVAAPE